jgi:hypothetical protein
MALVKSFQDLSVSVSKPQDREIDGLIENSKDLNWDNFIAPAPTSVAILATLCCIAAEAPPIILDAPNGGFKKLNYADFSTSMSQVAHLGHKAFVNAHQNMDKIKLTTLGTGGLKEVIDDIMKLIVLGDTVNPLTKKVTQRFSIVEFNFFPKDVKGQV